MLDLAGPAVSCNHPREDGSAYFLTLEPRDGNVEHKMSSTWQRVVGGKSNAREGWRARLAHGPWLAIEQALWCEQST